MPGIGAMSLVDAWSGPGLERAHLVLLGFGPLRDELIARQAPVAGDLRLLTGLGFMAMHVAS